MELTREVDQARFDCEWRHNDITKRLQAHSTLEEMIKIGVASMPLLQLGCEWDYDNFLKWCQMLYSFGEMMKTGSAFIRVSLRKHDTALEKLGELEAELEKAQRELQRLEGHYC